jgi:glycosyltransferase involved in cell wall biosynthesis
VEKSILLAIGGHWDSGNSVSLQFKAIADALVTRGYKVIVLVPGQALDKVVLTGNPLVYTWPSKRPTKLQDAIFLYRIIRRYQPLSIIGNFAAVNWILLVGWLLRVPKRFVWYHTIIEAINMDVREKKVVNTYQTIRKSLVYKLATTIVSVSDYAMNADLISRYGVPKEKIVVFHNLLRTPEYISTETTPKNLVCVGRLDYSKGHDVLLKAMPAVVSRFPDVQLRLIGDGKRREELEEMTRKFGIEKNVVFVGSVAPKDVLLEFSRSYACIHPARIDNCPLVLIEAMAAGVPVIASNAGGIPEIVRNDFNGILFSPENSEELSRVICKLLESPETRQRYSDNARSYFLSEFEIKQGTQKIINWLDGSNGMSHHDENHGR